MYKAIILVLLYLLFVLQSPNEWTVSTFNIRYDNPNDPLVWDERKGEVINAIAFYDIVGFQEVLPNQLEDLKRTVKETGKIWSVNFSERFHVAAVAKAEELVNKGKIGKIKQTIGTGPHRQGNYERPNWFYDRQSYGGIITDIGSHQIHQFLVFTNSNEAKINHALVENTTKQDKPGFQDFGEVNLTGNEGHGYIRLDWFTPDALPTWGDGRLLILGDKGYIEIRKYTDLAKSETGNHLYYANNEEVKHIDCSDVKLPYFGNLINDVLNRTESACSQELTYLTMELAIKAQEIAEKK